MTTTEHPSLQMPFSRPSVLQVSPLFDELRGEHPIVPVTTAAGDPAWLVLSYDECKQVYSDRRFAYFSHPDPEHAPRLSDVLVHSAPMGNVDFEAETTRLRKLMAPGFTPRRIKLLDEWIQQLTDQCLDDMQIAHDAEPERAGRLPQVRRLSVAGAGDLRPAGRARARPLRVLALSDRMGYFHGGMDAFAAMQELEAYMVRAAPRQEGDPRRGPALRPRPGQRGGPTFFSSGPCPPTPPASCSPGRDHRRPHGLRPPVPARRPGPVRDWLIADIPIGRSDRRGGAAPDLGARLRPDPLGFGGHRARRGHDRRRRPRDHRRGFGQPRPAPCSTTP